MLGHSYLGSQSTFSKMVVNCLILTCPPVAIRLNYRVNLAITSVNIYAMNMKWVMHPLGTLS